MKVVPGNRRTMTLAVTLVLLVVLVIVGAFVQVPYVSLGPGPTLNTLGKYENDDVVHVEGVQTREVDGHLNLTTVSVADKLTLFQALGMWFSGDDTLQPREQIFPPNKSKKEVQQQDTQQMDGAQGSAEVAALSFLKRPLKLTVQVTPGSPAAAGRVKSGDSVVSVDGRTVQTPQQLRDAVSSKKPGERVQLGVRSDDGAVADKTVMLSARPDDKAKGYLGALPVRENADPNLKISFHVGDIGGPSAGLMLTLAIIDKIGPANLTNDRFIAGTGTISDDGEVGQIGGITHKMSAARDAGAQDFLVPAGNCAEAKSDIPNGLRLVKVDTLSGAVTALGDIRAGKPAPSC